MANQIIRQPNGLYAVWSTCVDNFTMVDCTPQEIIDDWSVREREQIAKRVNEVIQSLAAGGKPYLQFTQTFDEAMGSVRERHGEFAVKEIEQMMDPVA